MGIMSGCSCECITRVLVRVCVCWLHRLEDALHDFTAAIDTDPSSALSFNSRALLLERLGQPAAALADHDAAVALDARDAGYIKSRGLCARTLGQYEAAARDFTRCVTPAVT
jgi:tetratricopeptide (TPR) repeat protein